MNFSDDNPRGRKSPSAQAAQTDSRSALRYSDPLHTGGVGNAGLRNGLSRDPGPDRAFPAKDMNADSAARSRTALPDEQDYARFQERMRKGRVKFCSSCGGIMRKSSRRVLSAPAGVALVILGAILMVLYGLATNFYQVPWFTTFALPAAYYLGSIFMGVGILFFFIRERVWICPTCREMSKR